MTGALETANDELQAVVVAVRWETGDAGQASYCVHVRVTNLLAGPMQGITSRLIQGSGAAWPPASSMPMLAAGQQAMFTFQAPDDRSGWKIEITHPSRTGMSTLALGPVADDMRYENDPPPMAAPRPAVTPPPATAPSAAPAPTGMGAGLAAPSSVASGGPRHAPITTPSGGVVPASALDLPTPAPAAVAPASLDEPATPALAPPPQPADEAPAPPSTAPAAPASPAQPAAAEAPADPFPPMLLPPIDTAANPALAAAQGLLDSMDVDTSTGMTERSGSGARAAPPTQATQRRAAPQTNAARIEGPQFAHTCPATVREAPVNTGHSLTFEAPTQLGYVQAEAPAQASASPTPGASPGPPQVSPPPPVAAPTPTHTPPPPVAAPAPAHTPPKPRSPPPVAAPPPAAAPPARAHSPQDVVRDPPPPDNPHFAAEMAGAAGLDPLLAKAVSTGVQAAPSGASGAGAGPPLAVSSDAVLDNAPVAAVSGESGVITIPGLGTGAPAEAPPQPAFTPTAQPQPASWPAAPPQPAPMAAPPPQPATMPTPPPQPMVAPPQPQPAFTPTAQPQPASWPAAPPQPAPMAAPPPQPATMPTPPPQPMTAPPQPQPESDGGPPLVDLTQSMPPGATPGTVATPGVAGNHAPRPGDRIALPPGVIPLHPLPPSTTPSAAARMLSGGQTGGV